MSLIHAVFAAFIQHWKNTTSNIWSLSFFISSVPQVAIFGWIAIQSPNPDILGYIIIGAPLMAIWQSVMYGISTSLGAEIRNGTIEFTMISRTSMMVVLFGKAMAMMVFGIPVGIISVGTILVIARQVPQIASVPYVIGSLVFIFIGLAVTGLLLAPIMALSRGRISGMYTPLIPFIIIFSGFLFPIGSLPQAMGIVARILPSSWVMESILQAVKGPESTWAVVSGWIYCLLVCGVLFFFTFILFKVVEKRLRVTGLISY